jgi:hypothetical protein
MTTASFPRKRKDLMSALLPGQSIDSLQANIINLKLAESLSLCHAIEQLNNPDALYHMESTSLSV